MILPSNECNSVKASKQFAQLLTDAVYRIRLIEEKSIGIVQDELGYAIGRQGGSSIEYWRKGHMPRQAEEVAALATAIAARIPLDHAWLTQFLSLANYPQPSELIAALIPEESDQPPSAAQTIIHNLIVPTTPLIGRERELEQLAGQLRLPDCRLLTITGPGGVGKTRLAQALAWQLIDNPDDDAAPEDSLFFIQLAGTHSRDGLVAAIAYAVALRSHNSADPFRQLTEFLAQRSIFLILDNFDQLVRHGVILAELLEAAPRLTIVVTSRERLQLRHEWVLPLLGLSVEREKATPAGATTLFINAAQRNQPNRHFDAQTMPAIERICALVEGMPLAIELAAAWIHLLTPEEIAAEIETSIDFLAARERDRPDRHQSLRAVCDYSWQQLNDNERQVFCALSVFTGGFDRTAAKTVAGASISILSALMDKSLLHATEASSGAGRYEIHEMLRQYAAEHLAANRVKDEKTRDQHAAYFLSQLSKTVPDFQHINLDALQALIATELENSRVAWQWAASRQQQQLLSDAAPAFWLIYELQSLSYEGEALFGIAVDAADHEEAIISAYRGWFLQRIGQLIEAQEILLSSLTQLESSEETKLLPFVLLSLAINSHAVGDDNAAADYLRRCLQQALLTQDEFFVGVTQAIMGTVLRMVDDFENANQMIELAATTFMRSNSIIGMAIVQYNRGTAAFAREAFDDAEKAIRACLDTCLRLDYEHGIMYCQVELGRVLLATGRSSLAAQLLKKSLGKALTVQVDPIALRATLALVQYCQAEHIELNAEPLLSFIATHPGTDQKTRTVAQSLHQQAFPSTPLPAARQQQRSSFYHQARQLLAYVESAETI